MSDAAHGLLRMSSAAVLGVHALAYLARREDPVPAARIAGDLGASMHHLHKVLSVLAREGVVESSPGPSGGYSLAVDPAGVTLLSVIELLDRGFGKGVCFLPAPTCADHEGCAIQFLNRELGDTLRRSLGRMTVLDIGWARGDPSP